MSIHIEAPVTAIDHVRGRVDAPITLVEYGDFECHYCAQAFPIVNELLAGFPDDLRFVFRHAPQTRLHSKAELAAEAAEAAGAQGEFWRYHDGLFTRPQPLTWERLVDDARGLGLDVRRFTKDVEEHRFLDIVKRIEKTGAHTVRSTPTFFLNDVRYEDASDFDSMAKAISLARSRTRSETP